VRVPVSQLKDTALNRLTEKVRQNLWVFLLAKKLDVQYAHDLNHFLQLISDRKRDQHELYEELASFTGGKPEDFMTSNFGDEQQWIADLFLKLEVRKMVPCTLVFCDTVATVLEVQGSYSNLCQQNFCDETVLRYLRCIISGYSHRPPHVADFSSRNPESYIVR
jgi:hypothetical protein